MSTGLVSVAYVVASICFILSLGGLSHQESARAAIFTGSPALSSPWAQPWPVLTAVSFRS